MNVSNFINSLNIGGESVLNTPKQPSEQQGGFWSALLAANAEKPGGSEMLFAAARIELSDEDIAALASRYNPGNMTRAQYEDFLTELECRGAITQTEHSSMKDWFMTSAGPDESGNLLNRLKTLPVSSPEEFAGREALSGIVERMDWALNGRSLMEQAADADGTFWLGLRRFIIENEKKKQEEAKEEETIEALSMMLDNMTGKNDPRVSAATGLRLSMNADQDAVQSGKLPSELYAYLLTLGGKTALEMVEEPEDKDGKIQQIDSSSAEKLYANSEKRQDLTEDDLAEFAKKYDPNNMSQEQYDKFLEELVELGIASQSIIERIGYRGLTAAPEAAYTSEILNAPAFQLSPVDGDIEGWIQNRVLWKPGITRESAKRAGFSQQYDRMIEEEKTLSRIAEILADVKRQRYPSVLSL